MKKALKPLSLLLIALLTISILCACTDDKPIPPQKNPNSSQSTDTGGSELSVFEDSLLSISYDDTMLRIERPDMDDNEIVKFEAKDIAEIEIVSVNAGDYKTAAEYSQLAEKADDDVYNISEVEETKINGYDCCYFCVFDEDSMHEYYFISYDGSSAGVSYVVFEDEIALPAVDTYSPIVKEMLDTLSFK